MTYTNGDGTYHNRRTCRRLHNTGGRIRPTDAGKGEPCEWCVTDPEPDTCQVVKNDGEVCGRERPCQYHD